MSARFASLRKTQIRNGGNSGTGNIYQGDVGFDYMGFSMDFLGGKTFDGVLKRPECTQLISLNTITGVSAGKGFLSTTISDNTYFQVGAKYTIGP